jgi:hypothetical protein
MYYYLYEIKNLINGKIYIGVHKTKNMNDEYMGSGKIIRHAIQKYGVENFTKTILETFNNSEEMFIREKEIVTEEFLKRPDVYNLRRGGHGGFDYINQNGLSDRTGSVLTELQKKNVSEGKKKSITPEHRMEQSDRLKGNKIGIGNRGNRMPRTSEHKENIKNSLSGFKHEIVRCPHCGKEGAQNAMKRWHFDNCKMKIG